VAAFVVAVAAVGPASAADAPVVGAGQVGSDLAKVIVRFTHHPLAADRRAIESVGGKVQRLYQLIDAIAARVPAGKLAALQRKANVASVELDHRIVASDAELDAAWGVKHIGAGAVHAAGNTGQGIKVGVIDTGIDYTHPDLDSVYAGGYDFFNNDSDPFDDNGHGTHVSGILAAEQNDPPAGVVGVAPGVQLFAYKVLGANGEGDYSGLIAALERATLVDHVDVVNMSLGGTEASPALADAVAAAYAHGVVLVAASGNVDPYTGQACPVAYPAAYDQVFATTFTGPDDALTGYSCTGPEVDFASPGDLIYSTVPTGNCMFCAPNGYRGDLSGTSMAAPHLSGTVALVLAHGISNQGDPTTLADDVKTHLCATTAVGTGITYFGIFHVQILPSDPRYPQYFGCGVIDADNALLTNPPPGGGPVNHAPVATDDVATVAEDGQVTVDVLANDSDVDGDQLSVSAVGSPAHGTATIDVSGAVVYSPTANFWGSDSFSYDVSDGTATATATVSVTVTAVNDPPVATDDSASTAADTPVTVDVLANDADVDGDVLAVSDVGLAAHGVTAIVVGGVSYTPAPGFSGSDSFGYTVSDGQGGFATATVSVTVMAANHPPVAADDSAITNQGVPVTVLVLANDSDVDGDTLAVSGVGQPAHGTAAIGGGGAVYTPAAGYYGSDSFGYTVSDGQGGTATATVSITVQRTMHVSDLDRSATLQSRTWTAKVTIRVRSATEAAVANATVSVMWSTGATTACTTGTGGNCTVTLAKIPRTTLSVTASVTSVARSGWTYAAADNHDPDADSDGTAIVVPRP
jgi:subtilisin family serine protease